jgi:hypothetical protein
MGHEAKTTLRALTVRQPWAFAITHGGKRVENRRWRYAPAYRGEFAVHAGAAIDAADRDRGEYAIRRVAELSGLPIWAVREGAKVRGAVVAVAQLADVCCAAFISGDLRPPRCGCPPWAAGQQQHLLLAADVRVLPAPVPCKGALGLWYLPDDIDAEVRVQLGGQQLITQSERN